MIPFNKPYQSGKELEYMQAALDNNKISGDGMFTKKCHHFFESKYNIKKALLTTSCTDALELAALLINIQPGDEVIIPSYTFVSTANAFELRGAKIVFADSESNNPNIDTNKLEALITSKTKAIVPVHYAGVACNMNAIMALANKYNLFVIEDAAQAIESKFENKYLGTIGHLAAFSFHETKNIISGEGGLLAINDEQFIQRAEIIREKGTNRSQFFRGEVDKYSWVDIGSSFLPSDLIAAYLFAQLESIEKIQKRRLEIWNVYFNGLKQLSEKGIIQFANIPDYASNNAHMFYIVCNNEIQRNELLLFLKQNNIGAVFHYISLHQSVYYLKNNKKVALANSDKFTSNLIRLPFYYELSDEQIIFIIGKIISFFNN